MVAGATPEGVCLLEFADRPILERQIAAVKKRFGDLSFGTDGHLTALTGQLEEYFSGGRTRFEIPLVLVGSPFQLAVWRRLQEIPFGGTSTYQAQAAAIGAPRAVRAVGSANGRNRISILIPCHRVIAKSGGLAGYGGGLWRKRSLLDLETRGGDTGWPCSAMERSSLDGPSTFQSGRALPAEQHADSHVSTDLRPIPPSKSVRSRSGPG